MQEMDIVLDSSIKSQIDEWRNKEIKTKINTVSK